MSGDHTHDDIHSRPRRFEFADGFPDRLDRWHDADDRELVVIDHGGRARLALAHSRYVVDPRYPSVSEWVYELEYLT